MIRRLVDMQWPVISTLKDQSNETLIPQQYHWILMEQLLKILEPFAEATELRGAENRVTISLRNPYVRGLEMHVDQMAREYINSDAIGAFCEKVGQQMRLRCPPDPVEGDLTWKATVLDPRYKLIGLSSVESIKLRSALEVEVVALSGCSHVITCSTPDTTHPSPSPSSTLNKLVQLAFPSNEPNHTQSSDINNTVREELTEYFKEKHVAADQDPLEWWSVNRKKYPNFQKLISKYMSVPATSTPSERIFSTGGNTANKLRSSLTGKHVEALVFLKHNE